MRRWSLLKDQLLQNLWGPICVEGGNNLYPRLRKNKKMKIFTLTSDHNFNEIPKLIEFNLIEEGEHLIWARTSIKKIRLETEFAEKVLHGFFQDEPHLRSPHFLDEFFPKDILNLDFSSQSLELSEGEIKKELESIDGLIRLENEKTINGFVILYTTIIKGENNLNVGEIESGLNLPNSEQGGANHQVSSIEDKKRNILKMVKKICNKYNYSEVKIDELSFNIPDKTEEIYSIAGIFKKD